MRVRVCVRIRLKSNVTIMGNETLFWGFIDDLKTLGDDVKAQVLFGGCRWGEPSPIPDVVERLSKLDYKEIENIFPMVICNDMAKKRLQEEVCLLFNYHSECSQDLAYSDNDKVSLYARWLNRFILICGKFGMTDIIPLSKQDDSGSGRNEPQQFPKELLRIFKGNVSLIEKLKRENVGRKKVAGMIKIWSKEGKCVNLEDCNKKLLARLLIENGIVEARNSNIDDDVESYRHSF